MDESRQRGESRPNMAQTKLDREGGRDSKREADQETSVAKTAESHRDQTVGREAQTLRGRP